MQFSSASVEAEAGGGVDGHRGPMAFHVAVALAACVGLGIRIWYLQVHSSRVPIGGDAAYYFYQAKALVEGHGFLDPYLTAARGHAVQGAMHPPGYTVFLALVRVLGFPSIFQEMVATSLLGVATVVLVGYTGRRVLGARVGVIAAVYPNLWINDTLLMSETLYVFGYALLLFGAFGFHARPGWRSLLAVSVGFTIAATARSEALFLFPLVAVPLVIGRRTLPVSARLKYLVAAAILPTVTIGGWSAYNLQRFDAPVLMSTQLGPTLAAANCGPAFYGPLLGASIPSCQLTPTPERPGGPPDSAVTVDEKSRRAAFSYMAKHKARLPVVVLARELRQLDVWRTSQSRAVDGFVWGRGSDSTLRWSQRMYWTLGVLALIGLVIWRRRRIPLYPLIAEFGVTALAAAIATGLTRFRAASEVGIVLLASCTLGAAIDWGLRHRTTVSPATTEFVEVHPTDEWVES